MGIVKPRSSEIDVSEVTHRRQSNFKLTTIGKFYHSRLACKLDATAAVDASFMMKRSRLTTNTRKISQSRLRRVYLPEPP
jgi:hypothetical protein